MYVIELLVVLLSVLGALYFFAAWLLRRDYELPEDDE
jgi:hypothetical protein